MLALTGLCQAQSLDVAFGLNTITAPSASQADANHSPQSLTGGAYPVISGDGLLFKNFGVQGELAWKGGRGEWGGFQPYRPLFYDFNAIWVPKLAKRTFAELMGGIGAQSTRFYTPTQTCGQFSCTNYASSNHFMGHFGAGIRVYPVGNFFIRPEAHLYLVNNNLEFSSARAVRYGVSIGYSFGGRK
jgi:hypothetical protein